MLSLKQINNVCLVNQGSQQCRYLEHDQKDYKKCYCKKQSADKVLLDEITEEHIQECKKNKTNPTAAGDPLGDNCQGFPFLMDVLQGYDV